MAGEDEEIAEIVAKAVEEAVEKERKQITEHFQRHFVRLEEQLETRERDMIQKLRADIDNKARDRADLIGQVAALHERYRYADLDACVTGEVRKAAKNIFNGNCAFIDDDIKLLAFCTRWAILNGIPNDLNPELIPQAKEHLGVKIREEAAEAKKHDG